jgi:hypothetical protein
MRRIIVFVLPALAICLAVAISVQASPTGSQTFHNGIRVDVRRDRNYDRIGHRFWAASRESVFAGMPIDNASPTDNGIFGSLASASMREERNDTGFLNLTLPGEWAPRTYGRVSGGPFLSEFRTGFAPTPEFSLSVGAAARSDPPAPTPEPTSITLVLSGLALGVVIYWFRRQLAMA